MSGYEYNREISSFVMFNVTEKELLFGISNFKKRRFKVSCCPTFSCREDVATTIFVPFSPDFFSSVS